MRLISITPEAHYHPRDWRPLGAAGPGAISFAGRATLKIENAALSAHHFGNQIDFFGKHDALDLTGLHFHAGATATYHKATHRLTVHSGHVTDTLTLFFPAGTHFTVANDGHGGSKVTDPPATPAHTTSIARHDLVAERSVADLAVNSNHDPVHMGDYLFGA